MQILLKVAVLCIAALCCWACANADTTQSQVWRCGMFFAGTNYGPPRAQVFVLPKRFPADCVNPRVSIYNRTCAELMSKSMNDWNFSTPSRLKPDSGNSVGDDFCKPITKEVRSPGLQIGFYFSYCNGEWLDTGLRTKTNLCCSQKKHRPC